jgi:ElaB/YqjD/DUF883 family membrane-anchored ribosome-binding protein
MMAAAKSDSETQEDLQALRDDFKSLREDMNALLKHLGTDAKRTAHEARARAEETVREQASHWEQEAQRHPLTTLGIALGAGVILGMALRR